MIRTTHRVWGASALGAQHPGEASPFGHRPGLALGEPGGDTVKTFRAEGGRHDLH